MAALEAFWDVLSSGTAYTAATRFAAVLIFAAVGEWVAERSGTLNISVEAMLLAGAFGAAMAMTGPALQLSDSCRGCLQGCSLRLSRRR